MIYSEAQLTIKRQQTVVDGVRTRASAIFAAATLATSFLGAQALTRSPKLDGLAWLAIGAFAAIMLRFSGLVSMRFCEWLKRMGGCQRST